MEVYRVVIFRKVCERPANLSSPDPEGRRHDRDRWHDPGRWELPSPVAEQPVRAAASQPTIVPGAPEVAVVPTPAPPEPLQAPPGPNPCAVRTAHRAGKGTGAADHIADAGARLRCPGGARISRWRIRASAIHAAGRAMACRVLRPGSAARGLIRQASERAGGGSASSESRSSLTPNRSAGHDFQPAELLLKRRHGSTARVSCNHGDGRYCPIQSAGEGAVWARSRFRWWAAVQPGQFIQLDHEMVFGRAIRPGRSRR